MLKLTGFDVARRVTEKNEKNKREFYTSLHGTGVDSGERQITVLV